MDQQNETNLREIKATPTKDFFIKMLIKDINFKDAIGDLVDNSVDGQDRLLQKKTTVDSMSRLT